MPPSDDYETSSADCSESSDDEVSVPDNNSGPSPPSALALSSWTAYTDDLPDFPGVVFTVSDPRPQVGSSNLGSELEFFQLFFTNELSGEIVQETNRHAQEKILSMDSLAEQSTWKSWEHTCRRIQGFLRCSHEHGPQSQTGHQRVFQPRNFEEDAARLSTSARSLTSQHEVAR